MSEITESVLSRLDAVLRYIAPGFVALFVVVAVQNGLDSHWTNAFGGSVWPAVLLAALLGVMVYSIHTSIIVRVIWFVIVLFHRILPWSWWIPERFQRDFQTKMSTGRVMFDLDTERWQRRASDDREVKAVQGELNKWAAMLNYLYCSSYPAILLPILLKCNGVAKGNWCLVLGVGIMLLLCAVISDWRITLREFWAADKYPGGKGERQKAAT